MKNIAVIFGTRPELIKLYPVIIELKKKSKDVKLTVVSTGQHESMVDDLLDNLSLNVDINFSVMKDNQDLFDITIAVLEKMRVFLKENLIDLVVVHGDTTTALTASMSAYYFKVPIAHVEAGLRTFDIFSPFPEEFNRQTIGLLANIHFAPTELNKQNLVQMNVDESKIVVTGNTAIDTLRYTEKTNFHHPIIDWADNQRYVLITLHRRETDINTMKSMMQVISNVLEKFHLKGVFPVHKNPRIRLIAEEIFGKKNNIYLSEPLNVIDFHNIMRKAYAIFTDSGGIQEEAPYYYKPVFVFRDKTERTEGVDAGTLVLCGTEVITIEEVLVDHLNSDYKMNEFRHKKNPYGDGFASERIVDFILKNSFNH